MTRSLLVLGLLATAFLARAQSLTVLAAASLRESFTEIAHSFEKSHPGVTVRLSFGGSQQLAASILLGAPADVFASADVAQMRRTVSGGKVAAKDVKRLCGNRLVIVYNASRTDIHGLGDLQRDGLRIALAKKTVPVGEYSEHVLNGVAKTIGAAAVARIRANVVVRDDDVRAVLLHVAIGEADAGIVYSTDVAAGGGKVKSIPIARALQPKVDYEIAPVSASGEAALAKEFIATALGKVGRQALAEHGFDVAPPHRK